MARGGMHRGGEGGCTCILCIPPGYAPAYVSKNFIIFVLVWYSPGSKCVKSSDFEILGSNVDKIDCDELKIKIL
jgi:hypothetical protein